MKTHSIHRPCRVCGLQKEHTAYTAREMMYGTRDVHPYLYCSGCETLQITDIPADMSQYYPRDYSSFTPMNRAVLFLKGQRLSWALFRRNLAGAALTWITGPANNAYFLKSVRDFRHSRILDVGCGKGSLLREMQAAGFTQLEGADPFIEQELDYGAFQVKKRFLREESPAYDLIMMHHSLEHVPDMTQTLQIAKRSLLPNGRLIIRMPVLAEAWDRYGIDWVQLDAPRHFHLMSAKGFRHFTARLGWETMEWRCDSSDLQFWGSEQYKANVPLNDSRSYAVNPKNSAFSKKQIRFFEEDARRLNASGRGDSAYFLLRPTP